MQFFERNAFQLMWIIAGLLFLLVGARRYRRSLSAGFAENRCFSRLSSETSDKKRFLQVVFCFLGIFFLILALARPQWGEEIKIVKRHGVDMVFVVDTSLSMLAEDLKPNRMRIAKRGIQNFLKRLKGDRIGLVAFAGSAFLQIPLTVDYSAFRLFLEALEVGYIPRPGSSLKEGFAVAGQAFEKTKDEQRVVVVFSDGESHTAEGEELIEWAQQLGIRVYAVGVGTAKGGPIPLRSGSRQLGGYKKDQNGEIIVSKLDDSFLKRLAQETGGLYYPATGTNREIALIYEDIQKLGKKEISEQQMIQREDRFQLFLAGALVLLCIEMIISDRKGLFAS
ncbi:MAG: VWA domain-containing protein [Candidatus Omnitrophica bacterium]|nr:VWA domain-containing protein [Candidatus Omnitrophota bacterium]